MSSSEIEIVGNMAYVKTDTKQLLLTVLHDVIAWSMQVNAPRAVCLIP